jgi:hypothetical protein
LFGVDCERIVVDRGDDHTRLPRARASTILGGMRIGALAAAALALSPTVARAGNGAKPRTLVQWGEPACMTLVDRSQDPVVHLDYSIEQQDTDVTLDEVADSRTHQFFATCRTSAPLDPLPMWITTADVDAAMMKSLLGNPVAEAQILAGNPEWEACWTRITADDDRRPITFVMAEAGVDWDTTAFERGAYTVHGYTYEPAVNVWAQRAGVVKVHDGDPDAAGPAAAFTTGEQTLYRDGVAWIEGCVDAAVGSTFTAQWAFANEPTPEWIDVVTEAVDGDAFAFEFDPPDELAGGTAALRATFTSPDGRSYTTVMSRMIVVLEIDDPGCTEAGFIDDSCDESEGTAATGTETTAEEHERDATGCACASGRPLRRDAGLFMLLFMSLVSRRRSCDAR